MFHPCTKAIPTVSCKGQKSIPCTYLVSTQQVETGQLLQHSDLAGPGADSSLVAVEDRLPDGVCKTQCYNIKQRAHLKQSRLGYSLEIAHANTDQAELSPGLGLARNKSLGHLKDHRFAAYRTCQRHLTSKRCEIGEP